jgi:hypothetical protein
MLKIVFFGELIMIKITYINQVPTGVVRATAAQVFFLTLLGIYFNQPCIVLFITVDFVIRVFNKSKYSLLSLISRRYVVPVLKLSSDPTNLKAKRFAAGIGLSLTLFALAGYFSGLFIISNSILGVLAFFSFLESFFGFCAGCRIYHIFRKVGIFNGPECDECKIA